MTQAAPQDVFTEAVHRLRAAYQAQRDSTNLVPPTGRPVLEQDVDIVDGIVYHTYWYERTGDNHPDGTGEECQVIRLADIPDTLSGAILRLKHNIPALDASCDYEIIGDSIRRLINPPPLPNFEDDSEDISVALAPLPEAEVSHAKHFLKKAKYAAEVQNLLGYCCSILYPRPA